MKIQQVVGLIDILRGESQKASASEFYMPMLHVFMIAAERPGITVEEVRKQTGYSASTVTRALQVLSTGARPKPSQGMKARPGFRLIDVSLDAENWRTKSILLTDKGRELLQKIVTL